MLRFLLPALAMMGGLLVLFAGAFGDLRSLPDLSDRVLAVVDQVAPPRAAPPTRPAPPASPPTVSVVPVTTTDQQPQEALQREIADLQRQSGALQAQIAQRTLELTQRNQELGQRRQELTQRARDLEASRAEADRLRQSIDTLQQQRQTEESSLARQKAEESARPKQPEPPRAAMRPPPPVAAPKPAAQQPATQPGPAAPAPTAPQQLLTARQWLAAGRPDEARRVLAMVQTQMVFQPVTPDQPQAQGGNASASDVGDAIRWLDMGASGQAMQAINRAIDGNGGPAPPRAWSGYAAQQPPAYPPPAAPTYYPGR